MCIFLGDRALVIIERPVSFDDMGDYSFYNMAGLMLIVKIILFYCKVARHKFKWWYKWLTLVDYDRQLQIYTINMFGILVRNVQW